MLYEYAWTDLGSRNLVAGCLDGVSTVRTAILDRTSERRLPSLLVV